MPVNFSIPPKSSRSAFYAFWLLPPAADGCTYQSPAPAGYPPPFRPDAFHIKSFLLAMKNRPRQRHYWAGDFHLNVSHILRRHILCVGDGQSLRHAPAPGA